jgi:hypothetical protein
MDIGSEIHPLLQSAVLILTHHLTPGTSDQSRDEIISGYSKDVQYRQAGSQITQPSHASE